MSDGYSDVISRYDRLFNDYLKEAVNCHNQGLINRQTLPPNLDNLHQQLMAIPLVFFLDEMRLPSYLLGRFAKGIPNQSPLCGVEELIFFLREAGKFSLLADLQMNTKYRDKLLVLVDDKGLVMPNGVYYQNHFWRFIDGDQDILLGLAKKRCCHEPFFGQPVIIVADKHRYRKHSFILKDVVDIHGHKLGRNN